MSSSSNSDGSSLTDREDFRNDLYDRIFEVHSTGSFATFGIVDSFVHPGISIDPIGTVRLPLTEEDARTLIQASHKAPFGKGTETVVDESVRKTWEIGAEKIHFLNERWQSCLDQTVMRVARELGVADEGMTVRAEFYKMLLYEKGAMFKAHKDTEKVPGMFGTLIICLPSKHTGGAVCLQHAKKSARFNTSETSAFDTAFIAWYTDVTHEASRPFSIWHRGLILSGQIEPVQTGYRWVLTYNLINESKIPHRSATALDTQTEQFVQALTRWHNLEKVPEYLAYPLDHQYTDRDLSLAQLKGDDYHRARHVAQSCTVSGEFYILLANMSMHIHNVNDEAEDPETSELLLTHIVDSEGFRLSIYQSVIISGKHLLRRISYDDREPEIQRGGNFMGNQYAEIDQFFKDSVMIIVPSRFIMSFLLARHYSHQALNKLMGRLGDVIKTDGATRLRGLLVQICSSALSQDRKSDRDRDLYLGPVAVTAAVLRDASLFTKVVEQITRSLEQGYYYALGELICFQDLVVQEQDIIEALAKSEELYQIHANLSSFRDGFLRGNPGRSDSIEVDHLRRWLDTRTSDCLGDLCQACVEDASALVQIILEREKEPFSQFILYQRVRAFVRNFQNDAIIVNALMVELCFHLQHSNSSTVYLRSLLQRITETAISSFDLARYAAYVKKTRPLRGPLRYSLGGGDTATPDNPGGPIKTFYECASAHEQTTTASRLLQIFQRQASAITVEQCRNFLIPFLESLLTVVHVSSPDVQACIQSLVTTYIIRTIGPEPPEPTNWIDLDASKSTGCCCQWCLNIEPFLRDPSLQRHTTPVNPNIGHLQYRYNTHQYLDVEKADCGSVTFTKTLRWWEGLLVQWEQRAVNTLKALKKLPQLALKDCLGDRYDEMMTFGSMVKLVGGKKTLERVRREMRAYETKAVVPQKRLRDEEQVE